MADVVNVWPKDGAQLAVELEDGRCGIIDVTSLLNHPMFQPLTDRTFFAQVAIDRFGGLVWPNGADICTDWIEAEMVRSYKAGAA